MASFVGGATGLTGREVVRALRAGGERTIAHVRPDSPRLEEWRSRFSTLGAEVDTTPWELLAMRATFDEKQPTHVFGLLGTTHARTKEEAKQGRAGDYEAVDYGMTVMLLEASKAMNERPRFIYLSAAAGDLFHNEYYRVRARVEAAVRSSGLPHVIVRPSMISGERDVDRPMERVASRALDATFGLLSRLGAKKLTARYAPITNVDLADAIVRAAFASEVDRVVEGEALRSS